ncbi:MAG: ImmA/IrrE family metallo-endopeptidase [Kiritimatiellae bacterium]|nr:ImmA/IrrE family metallo-endopeptidase [Kiritimatiellia bacterium]
MRARDFDRRLSREFRKRFGRCATRVPGGRTEEQERRHEIAELAESVAEEHCPGERTEPECIARAKRITISFGAYGEAFDGMLEWKQDRFHIFCNLDRLGQSTSPRARFTLAHELGHYYIDEHRRALASGRVAPHLSLCEYECALLAEQEADHFAAHLLMPAARFRAAARTVPVGVEGARRLADRFGTSLTASAIRYVALDLAPCAVIKWDCHGYAWKHLSSSAFRGPFRKTFEAPKDLAEDSPTRRAISRQQPPETGYFQAGTVASAWFPGIERGEWQDAVLVEEALPLGRHGVLTLLYRV